MGFTAEDRHLTKCKNTPIDNCVDWTQKYANLSHSFPLWTVSVFYLLSSVQDFQRC